MLVVAIGGALESLTAAYGLLAAYLVALLVRESVRTWSATPVTDVRDGHNDRGGVDASSN